MKLPDILTLHPQVYLSQREMLCATCGGTVSIRRQRVTGHPLDEAQTWWLETSKCAACGQVNERLDAMTLRARVSQGGAT